MIYIILLFLLFFLILFGIPLMIIQLKARRNGAKINLKETFGFYSRKTAVKSVFRGISINQKEKLNVEILELETHFLAGGNPELLMRALLKFRDQKEVSFRMLSAMDLAYKNLEELIERGIQEHNINIINHPILNFLVTIKAKFFYPLGVGYKNSSVDVIEKQIKQKLDHFGLNWKSVNIKSTEDALNETEFNSSYWTEILCLNLVMQNIEVKRR